MVALANHGADLDGAVRKMDLAPDVDEVGDGQARPIQEGGSSDLTVREKQIEAIRRQQAVNATWYREKGNKAFGKGQYDLARKLYTKGIRNQPTCKLFCNRSAAHMRLGEAEDASRDASLAIRLDPKSVKARAKKAMALTKLGRHREAIQHIREALEVEPNDPQLMNMLSDLESCCSHIETGQVLEEQLPSKGSKFENADGVRAVAEALEALKSAAGEHKQSSEVRKHLDVLRKMLKNRDCLDFMIASNGFHAIVGAFQYDNERVLVLMNRVLCELPFLAEQLMSKAEFNLVIKSLNERRVAIVSSAFDVADNLSDKSHDFREQLFDSEPAMNVLFSVFAKGPNTLFEKAANVIEKVAHLKRFSKLAVDRHSDVLKGLCRCCKSDDSLMKAIAVSVLMKVRGSKALLALLSGSGMATGMLNLLEEALSSVLEFPKVDQEYRFVPAAFTTEQMAQIGDILQVTMSLTLTKAFVEKLNQTTFWLLLIPLMKAKSDVQLKAVELLVSASRKEPELSTLVLKDKELFASFAEAFAGHSEPPVQEQASYLANLLCKVKEFRTLVLGACSLSEFICTAQDKTSDVAIVAAIRILFNECKVNEKLLRDLSANGNFLLKVVELWYSREGYAKQIMLQFMQFILSEEEASKKLTETASEGHVLALLDDLARHKAMMEAFESGGASLLAPAVDNDLVVAERAKLIEAIDCTKVGKYLQTLLPPSEDNVCVIDVCSFSGMICIPLAQMMSNVAMYAVDWVKGFVEKVELASNRAKVRNVYPVLCDYETVDSVPSKSKLALLMGVWGAIEDPPLLFGSIRAKLEKGGKLVIVESEEKLLKDAQSWASKAGFQLFTEPKHIERCSMCVMQSMNI